MKESFPHTGKVENHYAICILWLFDCLIKQENKCIVNVVSPLLFLMQDQVEHFRVEVSSISLSYVTEEVNEDVCSEFCQVIFLSPKSLLAGTDEWKYMILNSHSRKLSGSNCG